MMKEGNKEMEKSFPTLPHMHQVKDVSLAMVVLIVDFVIPEIVLLQHFKTQGRVFSNQKRMMRTWKSSRKKNIKYMKIQELWSSFDVGPSSHL